ncbi:MAG: hypothetical protein D3923_19010 [Candidatus Electrothrix sp. AR3]|nr:hypothetical protein [Candidatus Electrothrix sp. AR3]
MTDTEYSFRNILHEAVSKEKTADYISGTVHQEIIDLSKKLTVMMDEKSEIVDFFKKSHELKSMKKEIKHGLIDTSFGDDDTLIKTVQDEFIDHARNRFEK